MTTRGGAAGVIVVETRSGRREHVLDSLVDPSAAERGEADAIAWIKQLRHAQVDGSAFRDRFTHRGDSLWWFAELYLHKQRVIAQAVQAVAALEALADAAPGSTWTIDGSDPVLGHVAHLVAARRRCRCEGPPDRRPRARDARRHLKALFHTANAFADRLRPAARRAPGRAPIAVFVHTAFLRPDTGDETYTGPVMRELSAVRPGGVHLVGLGPRTNFRVRGWRDRVHEFADPAARDLPVTPVESFSRWSTLRPSHAYWTGRRRVFTSMAASADLRSAAVIAGYDLWPLVSEQLEGIASLQFPWSARAMDEAGAALDVLRPEVVVTYAEAGGWGRALMLEARRRGIATVALQHGFIYRHWLNYLHEPDEMAPSAGNPADVGFPAPVKTLLFDEFAREHLLNHGHFAPASLAVTGSPRLDALVASARRLDAAARAALRERLGVPSDEPIVLVAAKLAQMRRAFPVLVAAVSALPRVHIVVKAHPAEDPAGYLSAAAGTGRVGIAPRGVDLGELTALASVLVTANSTAAIEAMPLDVPALVVELPNNLSPFVDAGVMTGAPTLDAIGPALRGLLYDREMLDGLRTARRAFMNRYALRADGGAAARAAAIVTSLTRT